MKIPFLSILCSLVLLISSCRKDSFITSGDARIYITVDSLKYDTVFSTVGSVTQSFKIINENNQKLRLNSIKLMGGSGSNYKMNVDGIATSQADNIDIEANDSVYVFVQVNVDPVSGDLPFIIRDSIQISYNGNQRLVQLEAWGQNAHFFRNRQIIADETWTNDIPYVVLGFLYVDPNVKLTIEKGCRIYMHADAPIVVEGSLEVNGGADTLDRVYFRGDRMDEPYKNYPAAWPGIFFSTGSTDNVLNYAVIKNAYQAIVLENPSVNLNPKLVLNECVIDNSYDAGILATNSSVTARNCLISNCGKNISLTRGGEYAFTHCTVATYSNSFINHKDPVLFVSNHDGFTSESLNAVFRNCIFWGENGLVEDEVVVSKMGASPFTVNFDHVLWKVQTMPNDLNPAPTEIINDQSPEFDSIDVANNYYNFRLKETSPAIGKGASAGVLLDLDGKPRPAIAPDLGAFQRQ